jgi:hypothetical protein
MHLTTTIRRHARLFSEMADAQGVDLEEAVLRARIAPDEIAEGVLRCTGCTNPDTCEAALQAAERLEDIPSFCRNSELLEALKVPG